MSSQGGIRVVGRYALHGELASGGMATVLYGRLRGPVGFSRTVAIKRLHSQYAREAEFVSMFVDEARLAARIRHPNVVGVLDAVATAGELFLVMDYVPGESLAVLTRVLRERGERIPPAVAVAIVTGILHGLHAAHELKGTRGESLDIVHRDVSPQNVLVGTDGIARVLDFGIAKASRRLHTSREGQLKGKLAYMSPEQIRGLQVTRSSDIYATSVVLWELLTGKRLFTASNEGALLEEVLLGFVDPPSSLRPELPQALDDITLQGVHGKPEKRFSTAREMALALERYGAPAMPSIVGEWVESIVGETLAQRTQRVAEIEAEAETEAGPHMSEVLAELSASVAAAPTIVLMPNVPGPRSSPPTALGAHEDDRTDPNIDADTLKRHRADLDSHAPLMPPPSAIVDARAVAHLPANPPANPPVSTDDAPRTRTILFALVVALALAMVGVLAALMR